MQKEAADKWLAKGEKLKAINCLELIVKKYLQVYFPSSYTLQEKAMSSFHDTNNLISDESPGCSPLTYSTLGCYLYLREEPEKAREMLKRGIGLCKEKQERLVLLNNYMYACDGSIENSEIQEELSQGVRDMKNIIFNPKHFLKQWLKVSLTHWKKLIILQNEKEDRRYEIIMTAYNFIDDLKDQEKLTWITYLNYCKHRASLLIPLIPEDLQQRIKEFCWSLNKGDSCGVLFEQDLKLGLEMYRIILQFWKILKDCSKNELKILREEVDAFAKDSEQLYNNLKGEAADIIFDGFFENDLFTVLTGFVTNYSSEVLGNELSRKVLFNYIKQKLHAFSELQVTDNLEISFPQINTNSHNYINILEDIFSSNPALKFYLSDVEILRGIRGLKKFKYQVQLRESQWKLSEISVSYLQALSDDLYEEPNIKLIAKTPTSLEGLIIEIIFPGIFEKVPVIASLLSFKTSFTKDPGKRVYFDDNLAEHLAKYIGSLSLLESLEIYFGDALLTADGVSFLEEQIKKLSKLKSFKLHFKNCPRITEDSITSLVETINKSSEMEYLTLKFESCTGISLKIGSQLKEKMGYHLKNKAIIEVMLIPLSLIWKNKSRK